MAFTVKNRKELIASMTLEEKASLLSGKDFWYTKEIARLGIDSWMMTDGPHGMRKQATSAEHVALNATVPSTCFPSGSALAATWNPELIRAMGEAMAVEARSENVRVLLGPAVNIKRSPLCGRNFEYFSEDPFLAGSLAEAHIRGIQSMGVGTSIKHFAVNNQEKDRMTVDAVVDERTLREIYLPAFERAITKAKPWTVMCSYNRINGTYGSQNKKLLTDILRDEWGYDGVLVTDWTACDDRIAGLLAGQDLEMPGNGGINDRLVVEAVKAGKISESDVDRAVDRLLLLHERVMGADEQTAAVFDHEAHHEIARRVAEEAVVLLKNDGGILPLAEKSKVALIGAFAKKPRYQGGGSSHINPTRVDALADSLAQYFPSLVYSAGYDPSTDVVDSSRIKEACDAACKADIAVLSVGLTDTYESEGFDRVHMRLPASHVALIEAVARVQPNLVVVLSNGSPVEMPWAEKTKAILEGYLAGQAGSLAIAEILAGRVNPSGKLAETFPLRIEDTPCFLNFPGSRGRVEYREGVFVGYRYYDSVRREVLYPFGHGLSYTEFKYSDLILSGSPDSEEGVTASLTVTNSGNRSGKDTVQFYVSQGSREEAGPIQELKGFAKVDLAPLESTRVEVRLDERAFSWYDASESRWKIGAGEHEVRAGSSSRDIRLTASIRANGSLPLKRRWTRTDTLDMILKYPGFKKEADDILIFLRKTFAASADPGSPEAIMNEAMFREMPLRGISQFAGPEGERFLSSILDSLNRN